MSYYSVVYILVLGIILSIITTTSAISPALLLTPLIKQNQTEKARNSSLVDPSLFLNLTSHSGFLTVDEKYNSNTFFWYFPVVGKLINETPWIIWLQGGPGATSLAGLFDEIGPLQYNKEARKLQLREASWTNEFSMLFIDNPIGAGYSFTDSREGFARNMSMYSEHLYSALQQFLQIFPEQRVAPLYVAGESYAGRYVPALATKIVENARNETAVKLQGIILGNPVLNRENIQNLSAVFYQWGLIDSQGALAVQPLQEKYASDIKRGDNEASSNSREDLINKLINLSLQENTYNLLVDSYKTLNDFEEYIGTEAVREAMHVGEIRFAFRNASAHDSLVQDMLVEVESKVTALLEHCNVLIYCGQLDLTAPCVQNAEARRRSWHWSHRQDFINAVRYPWWFNESLAGYVKSGGRFTEVLVRGAGHLVPKDKPAQVKELISLFIRGIDLPKAPNFEADKNDTPDFPFPTGTETSTVTRSPMTGMIVSVIVNVILVMVVIAGVVSYIRMKRRNEAFLYNNVDNVSDDIFLS